MDLERLEKKSEKASARTERVRAKMPKEKRYKIERSFDDTTGQVKKRLVIEQRDKIVKDSFIKKQGRMITGTASNKIHSKIAQVEHENTAVEAAHRTEQQAEDVLRYINRKKRSKYQRELKKLEKAQKKELKANTKYQYEKFKKENPQYDRNIMKKHLQKRRIRKEYKARMRQQAVRSVNTLAASLKEMLMKKKGIMIGTAIGALLFMMIASSLGSCGVMMSGGGSGTVAGSYLSEPTEIDKADNSFSEKEIALQNTINHIEREHPGFDEYRYNLGPIGHSPFELVNYLSAKNISFTYDDIQPQIQSVFDEMYQLHLRHVRERRTRTETRTGHRTIHHQDGSTTSESYEYEVEVEYYVDILETTLTVKELSAIANENLTTDQKQLYEVYETTHGGLQQFSSPVNLYWYNYVSSIFGNRKNPVTGLDEHHDGIDISLPEGTKVFAGMDGSVSEIGNDSYFGNYIKISDSRGFEIMYGHLSEVNVSSGQSVTKGMQIGKSGQSGNCNEPHLHLQISQNGTLFNPLFYFDAEQATLYGEGPGDGSGITPPDHYDDATAERLLTEAARYLNYPYVWGGSSPATSFDCSGYVCWVFTNSGVRNLPRTTAQGIYNQCTPISLAEAKAGDLIFFTRTYNSGNPVTHVGIYCGNNIFIHCGDPIKYANVTSTYWSNHYYSCGRLN